MKVAKSLISSPIGPPIVNKAWVERVVDRAFGDFGPPMRSGMLFRVSCEGLSSIGDQ